jgi:parallel beta-helix repeat protein
MKGIISGIIVALLLIGMLTLAFNIQPAKAQSGTIYINPDGSIDPSTANITTSDDVTYTFSGNNYLPIVVSRSNIIINGMGHTLQAPRGTGFSLTHMSNVTIKNTTITNSYYGIWLDGSSGNVLSGNNVTANSIGVDLESSSDKVLSGNNLTANSAGGIVLRYSSDNNTLSNNNATAYSVGVAFISTFLLAMFCLATKSQQTAGAFISTFLATMFCLATT